jgi:hypothetical protein
MNKKPVKSVLVRLSCEEYERLRSFLQRHNLTDISDNQVMRKLVLDQLDLEEARHEPKQQRHASAMGVA